MNGFALLLATALLGVDYGWQPASDGRLEYIIQLEPVTLIALREGQEVVSQIDPFVRDVRRFRIRVGTDVVPRLGTPAPETAAAPPTASAPPPGVSYGWQPVNAQQVELFVQIAPDRLIALQNDPIVGEIPFELRNVARVRIRSGVAELPRQNLAAPAPIAPVSATAPSGNQPVVGLGGPAPAAGNGLGAAVGTGAAAGLAGAAAANPASSWPANNVNPAARQPSRYDPPANAAGPTPGAATAAPAGDPRAAAAFNAGQAGPAVAPPTGAGTAQNPSAGWPTAPAANTPLQQPNSSWPNAAAQPPSTSWPATGQPAAGGLSLPQPPTSPNAVSPPAGQGLTDPNGSSGWGSGMPAAGAFAGAQPPATAAPGWGTPDDRSTTERGQWTGNAPTAGGVGSSWTPMVPLPQAPAQGPSPAWPSPPSSAPSTSPSWLSSFSATGPAGEMVSPFADPLTPATRPADSLASPTQSPWGSAGGALTKVGFSGDAGKKKQPDFWADLAAAANDPATGFLRDEPEASSATSDKPWWPLTMAMLALFASLGGNLYMGWIAVDVYRRYLEMADDGFEQDEDEDENSPRSRDDRRDWDDSPRRRERVAVED